MAVGGSEIPLALLGWCAVGFPGQTTAWHRISSERFQIRWLQAGSLSCLDGLLSGSLGLGGGGLGFLIHLGLLSSGCIGLVCSYCFGAGFLRFLLPLSCSSRSGLRLHLLAHLADPCQATLLMPQFIGQLTATVALAVPVILQGIEDFGLAHQGVDLLVQLLLRPEHPLMAHGFVLGGIGLNLRAIQRHMAQAHHPGLLAQAQDLHEQALEGVEVAAAELTDPAVVRLLVAGEYPKGQVLVAGPLDLARGDDAHAVGVEQQQGQHPRIESLLPAGILGLSGNQDLREIELIHQVQQEIHLMVLREPLPGGRRQQGGLLRLPGAKGLALLHAPFSRPDPLQSLGSRQIQGRLSREPRRSTRNRLLAAINRNGMFPRRDISYPARRMRVREKI